MINGTVYSIPQENDFFKRELVNKLSLKNKIK